MCVCVNKCTISPKPWFYMFPVSHTTKVATSRGQPPIRRGSFHTHSLVLEYFGVPSVGVLAPELPDVEEGFPVDEVDEVAEVVGVKHTGSQKLRQH